MPLLLHPSTAPEGRPHQFHLHLCQMMDPHSHVVHRTFVNIYTFLTTGQSRKIFTKTQTGTNFQSVCLNCMGTLNPVVNLHVLCRSIATGVYSTHFRTPTSEREPKDCHFPCGVPSVKTNITLENNQKMASFNSSYMLNYQRLYHMEPDNFPRQCRLWRCWQHSAGVLWRHSARGVAASHSGGSQIAWPEEWAKRYSKCTDKGDLKRQLVHTYIYIHTHIGLCIYILRHLL